MARDELQYDKMMEEALRRVPRQALELVARKGLPGQHHFYLTFRTGHPGVVMPDYLRQRHPQEMTIVLQHQFWGLEVGQDSFTVSLSFNQAPERMTIPFAALAAFVDPSVQFGLQFPAATAEAGTAATAPTKPEAIGPAAAAAEEPPREAAKGQVVTLDAFRKK
ncbi:MAG: hypothetical protein HY246_24620 [Proteobacteria bacterium]|nr:hypothetical protein [Pseudomonadota bacterium]